MDDPASLAVESHHAARARPSSHSQGRDRAEPSPHG
jgi:hypothetical protein